MSTLKEIEDAIRALPKKDREQLADDLPSILPEINGDAEWRRIINDPRPSKKLNALVDKVEAQMAADPSVYPLITEEALKSRE